MQSSTSDKRASFGFEIEKRMAGTRARTGLITTPHGIIRTPAYLPVGTLASVKALTPDELVDMGADGLLANTYHLHLRPGEDIVEKFGGIHGFMGWDGPVITDSGGFQAFSLGFAIEHGVGKIGGVFPGDVPRQYMGGRPSPAGSEKLATIDEDGVTFRSHVDGSIHQLTSERSIQIQAALGADIILAFDECTSPLATYEYTRQAMHRTHRWAQRSLEAHHGVHRAAGKSQALFGIVQGGEYRDLREEAAATMAEAGFDGFAIGGSLGKSKQDMHKVLDWTVPGLPEEKARHLLGIGEFDDLFEGVERGIDTFDCVIPTRLARTGAMYVSAENPDGRRWRINIFNSKYRTDQGPIDPTCGCYVCRKFSRGYLRHLFVTQELLAYRLASFHNVHFIIRLMRDIRRSLEDGSFATLKARWLDSSPKANTDESALA